jgi:hypothetical protein
MFRAAVLSAIARGVDEGGDVDTAHAALAQVDPLLRRRAGRLIRDAYVDALRSTRIKKGHDATCHVLRIAYLRVAGAPPRPEATDDPDAIAAAFEAARAKHPRAVPRFWWATAILCLTIALASVAFGLVLYRAFGPPRSRDASARAAPPPRGAFATGGKLSPGHPSITRALAETLPEYLVELDHLTKARHGGAPPAEIQEREAAIAEARQRVLVPEVRSSLGAGAAARLEELLTAAREASAGRPGLAAEAASARLLEATAAFDDELAAVGLGYFIDGDVLTDIRTGQRLVILYSFTVESIGLFASGGVTIRALDLRRLDHLNWTHTLLGFTRPHMREALVLLDQVDEQLVTYILPGLGRGAGIELFDDDGETPAAERPPPARAAVEQRGGELARAEYGATPGLDAARAEKMGRLLSRRRALVEGWQKALLPQQITLQMPAKLRLEGDYERSLRGMVPKAELAELSAIDDEIGEPAFLNAYALLRDVLVDSVERHEVQHRLDFAREGGLPMPNALEAYIGPAERRTGEEERFAAQARTELSAYLAELSRDLSTTRVNLTLIARFLFKRQLQGTAECYAAVVIFEGLAAELSLPVKGPVVQDGHIDRGLMADLYLTLTALPPADLRAAAARLWEKLFQGRLPELHPVTAPGAAR